MTVELVHWPAEEGRRAELVALATPRLLLVAPEAAAPITSDPMEDWIRLPAPDEDLRVRIDTLRQRAGVEPTIDTDGLVRQGADWVALPPVEARLAARLLARFGKVVSRDELLDHGWPGREPGRNVLDVHILRLRRRLEPLGLSIRTVRKRGYVLDR